jgi:hypothetical protein
MKTWFTDLHARTTLGLQLVPFIFENIATYPLVKRVSGSAPDYWRYGKVLRSISCERPSLNEPVVLLFAVFSGNLFQSFIVLQKRKICNCLYYIGFV